MRIKKKYDLVKRFRNLFHENKAFRNDCLGLHAGRVEPMPLVKTLVAQGYGDDTALTLEALATFVGQEAAYQSLRL